MEGLRPPRALYAGQASPGCVGVPRAFKTVQSAMNMGQRALPPAAMLALLPAHVNVVALGPVLARPFGREDLQRDNQLGRVKGRRLW